MIRLVDPDRANLLAIIIHRILGRASGALPTGTIQLNVGAMKAHLSFGDELVVRSGERAADCTIEAGLSTLMNIMTGDSFWGPWLTGKIHVSGNPLKALRLLRGVQ